MLDVPNVHAKLPGFIRERWVSHPYISGPGNISQMIARLRDHFPAKVDSALIKKYGLAPNNESYLLNALQFVGVIDKEGNKTEAAKKVFSKHKDEEFQTEFSELVRSSYHDLFDTFGDGAWHLNKDQLIGFFRAADDTSAAIGGRQASTFMIFSALCGYGDVPPARGKGGGPAGKADSAKPSRKNVSQKPKKEPQVTGALGGRNNSIARKQSEFALTVRIEINLPSDATRGTYDDIFKSIRDNLIPDNDA